MIDDDDDDPSLESPDSDSVYEDDVEDDAPGLDRDLDREVLQEEEAASNRSMAAVSQCNSMKTGSMIMIFHVFIEFSQARMKQHGGLLFDFKWFHVCMSIFEI